VPEGTEAGVGKALPQSSLSPTQQRRRAPYRRVEEITIAGQPWKFAFATNDQFERASGYSSTGLVCLAGLIISFALFGFTQSQAKEQIAAERHADELRRSKAQLEESEQRFRTMADHAPVLIWIAGPDKLCHYFNKLWLELTGRTIEQELGNGWMEGVHLDDRPHCQETYLRSFMAQEDFKIEFRLRRYDGHYRWMLNHGVPLFGPEGKFIGFIGSCVDITNRKHTEEAVQRLNTELEGRVAARTAALRESHEQMESFTYTVAHDLRAPLRAMQGFAAALLEDYGSALDDQAKDFMQRIMASAQRMDALIQDLLAYSRISRTPLLLEKVRLEKIVESVRSLYEPEIKSKQATLLVEAPLPEVTGHAGTLETILANLVSNALKFVQDSVPPRVRIRAEEGAERVRLWVEDNGIGIEPQYQDRIFRVFERLHGTERYPGTGIGLAIVRKGAERMGGTVGLESQAGQGSRFWVDLPK
jgi:PAS domain S-box-containing protein